MLQSKQSVERVGVEEQATCVLPVVVDVMYYLPHGVDVLIEVAPRAVAELRLANEPLNCLVESLRDALRQDAVGNRGDTDGAVH